MGMYGSRAVTLLVLISDDVINRILKLDIQTNILIYVTRCCTDLTSKVLKERTFGQSSALLMLYGLSKLHKYPLSLVLATSNSYTTTEVSILLTTYLTVIKNMLLNIVKHFMRGMVKVYFGLLNIQVRFLII